MEQIHIKLILRLKGQRHRERERERGKGGVVRGTIYTRAEGGDRASLC